MEVKWPCELNLYYFAEKKEASYTNRDSFT